MMSFIHKDTACRRGRPGTIIALMALTIVALIGFLGLAIDLGMLAIAKTQAQNAADLACLTAARTLNGDSSNTYNNAAATTNAKNLLTYNYILGQAVTSSQLSVTYGSYDYNQSTQAFNANFPATSGVPYTAVAATITATNLPGAFSSIFSQYLPTITATAQAVHRPRDIGLVMDLSGSMRFGTCLGYDFYTSSRTTNNPDTNVPSFGHYSSASAGLTYGGANRTSAYDNYSLPTSNTTVSNSSYTRTYINNFYQSAAYASTLVRAFDSYTSTDGGNTWSAPKSGGPLLPAASYTTTPGGDQWLYFLGSASNYAQEVEDVLGSTNRNPAWELDGYSNYVSGSNTNAASGLTSYPTGLTAGGQSASGAFSGYTKGPGYYGKTFFIWPPDPRRPLDTGNATSWSTTAKDTIAIEQFLVDFGYTKAGGDWSNTSFKTTLAAAIAKTTTLSMTVNSNTPFPVAALPGTTFKVIINNAEIVKVTAVAGTTWTITRGQDGTSATTHALGESVGLVTAQPLNGIFSSTTTTGSQSWPWPAGDDATGGTAGTLSKYLLNNVYIPVAGTARLLLTTDAVFQKIMRLYNWDYVIDNVGTPCDWRIRFFGTNDNTAIFNASGSLNPPGSAGMWPGLSSSAAAIQTYNEILRWLNQSTDPFPTQLRAGRIKYYGSAINPTASATVKWNPTYTNGITGTYPNWGGTDQRFWVEFINHVLGFYQTGATSYTDISAYTGYGSDFTWGTVQRKSPPTWVDPIAGSPSATQNVYMDYQDNPLRPKLRHWFSPILMVDLLQNYNYSINQANFFFMQPGDSYEAPLYTGKEGFLAAVTTMQNNHPNDWFTLAFYSWPRTSKTDLTGRLNGVACPLGTNYAYAKASLLFPFSTINADGTCNNTEVTPYDTDPVTGNIPSANFLDTPRADGNTCFAMGLMLCYNQFAVTQTSDNTLRAYTTSSPITFPTGMAGGMGRKGSQKVIIFETDGLANTTATASLVSASGYNYYKIRYDMNKSGTSEYPSVSAYNINDPTVTSQVYSLIDQLVADYGTSRNPFRLYTLGFGPVFTGPDASAALTTLQTMQFHAGTQSSAATALPSNQIITGTDSVMLTNMTAAFTSILQNGVQIALIK